MDVRFSVVVCTYNSAHFLPDALRSLAAQTVSDFELLVADDGSTDLTAEVVQQFRPQFRNCQYLKKPHTGLADTRNFAIQASHGTHIAFLDADDLWSPRYLETMYGVLVECQQAELIFANGYYFRNDGAILRAVFPDSVPASRGPIRTARELFDKRFEVCPSGTVFSKALFERVGSFNVCFHEGIGDDSDWTMRAVIAGAYRVCLKRKLFLYRRHASNLTNRPAEFARAWLMIYAGTLKEKRSNPEIEAEVRGYLRWYLLRLLAILTAAEGRGMLRLALEVLNGDPILRLYYSASYLGLPSALRLAKAAKEMMRRQAGEKLRVDLRATPEAIFAGLPE